MKQIENTPIPFYCICTDITNCRVTLACVAHA